MTSPPGVTTLVLRNLPPTCTTETLALSLQPWQPDLVVIIPNFELNPNGSVPVYAFANFMTTEWAAIAYAHLQASMLCFVGTAYFPRLNVAWARLQGFECCYMHCLSRRAMMVMRPWIHPSREEDHARLFRRRALTAASATSAEPMFMPLPVGAVHHEWPSSSEPSGQLLTEQSDQPLTEPSDQPLMEPSVPAPADEAVRTSP